MLANEPVEVVAGAQTVGVQPQGVSKGQAVQRILAAHTAGAGAAAPFAFALCVGDDTSDEHMYAALQAQAEEGRAVAGKDALFACTVGQKPSFAPFYINDAAEVLELLQHLVAGEGAAAARPRASMSGTVAD